MQGIRRHEATVEVAAPPEVVFHLITDLEELARWHPAVDTIRWDEAAPVLAPGRRFVVSNVDARFDWQHDHCEILSVDPPREFSFARIDREREAARWHYHVAPLGDGARVTAVHLLLHENLGRRLRSWLRPGRHDVGPAVEIALESLRRTAEATVRS